MLEIWPPGRKIVIGMLHLRALPGAPGYGGDLAPIRDELQRDAEALVEGGVDGLLIENFGDAPFFPRRVPPQVVAQLTTMACAVRRRFDRPLGINVLRNDGLSALAIALAAGGAFIRVNVLCGARVADQGILEGIAHDLLRERVRLGAAHMRILADVNVKHSTPLGPPRPIEDELADVIQRGRADAVVVSGSRTGQATDVALLQRVKAAAGKTPVLVGSGVSVENVREYLPHLDGLIVGTALKQDGRSTNPVDLARVRALMAQVG